MPPQTLPPTPVASTELAGKDLGSHLHSERTFNLPPPAYAQHASPSIHEEPRKGKKGSSAQTSPAQPFSTPKNGGKKRTASQAALVTEDISLPPPPSRSRKIIQMKPKEQDTRFAEKHVPDTSSTVASGKAASGSTGKKKQGGSTAGRKIARKTAHSLIERRRRSKMNEEFGVLKDMIPACAGQEMHKLAILQASIDYMRYLEKCVAEVKGGKQPTSSSASSTYPTRPQSATTTDSQNHVTPLERGTSEPECVSTMSTQSPRQYQESAAGSTLISPAMSGITTSPAVSAHPYGHAFSRNLASNLELPSPAGTRFPSDRSYAPHNSTASAQSPQHHSGQASPALLPQSSHSSAPSELDQEASAALLMLNASDRRTSISKGSGEALKSNRSSSRGISVKDLLRS